MLKNNLLIAIRSFWKNKGITSINVLGLAIGISAALIIFLIIQYDYNFDKWEPNKDRIYRVYTKFKNGSNSGISQMAPSAIKESVTGIDKVVYFERNPFYNYTVLIPAIGKTEQKIFTKNDDVVLADESYFTIFPHQWIVGNAQSLSQLNQTVLSLSNAKRYFPDLSPEKIIGQKIIFDDSIVTTVSGIVADLKEKTDFDNKVFISFKTISETALKKGILNEPNWTNVSSSTQCFVLLHPQARVTNIDKQIKKLFQSNIKDLNSNKYAGIGVLQPLDNIHFNTEIDGSVSKDSLRNLSILAIVLLLLAVINFINLSTAQSTLRAKEIGVRKTFGGSKKQIIYQFLTETFLLTILAAVLAVILSPFLIYIFKGFVPEGLSAAEIWQPKIIAFLITLILIVTLFAGLYPAFVLSKFRPALVLKNMIVSEGKSRSTRIRQTLTVSQFVIAQVFLIVVFVIGKQIHFVLNKDLGFKKDAIISFYIPDFLQGVKSKQNALANELRQIPDIQNLSGCTAPPVRGGYNSTSITWYDKGEEKTYNDVHVRSADDNYLSLFNLQLIAGKNIHKDTSAKITDVVINETLLHQMGLSNPQDIIGNYIKGGPSDSAQIVGVVKDFTTMSLHNPVQPTTIFANNRDWTIMFSVLLNNDPASWKKTISRIEKSFKSVYPDKEFEYKFFNESIKSLYETEAKVSMLLKWATGLAISISCLGLLGLISFMANQRVKEIGIRKVLGASVMQIIVLLSKSLLRLIAIASIIAFPIAWYFSNKWLQDFAFRTNLSWWVFLISAVGMLAIALAVLCLRTFRSATMNPVESLRTE